MSYWYVDQVKLTPFCGHDSTDRVPSLTKHCQSFLQQNRSVIPCNNILVHITYSLLLVFYLSMYVPVLIVSFRTIHTSYCRQRKDSQSSLHFQKISDNAVNTINSYTNTIITCFPYSQIAIIHPSYTIIAIIAISPQQSVTMLTPAINVPAF